MGINCYCKQGAIILNQSEMEVYDTVGKKEDCPRKEEIIKLDIENLSLRNNFNKLHNKKTQIKRVSFAEKNIKEKDKDKEKNKNNKNNGANSVKRKAKEKIMQTIKTPQELVEMKNKLKLNLNDENSSINKDNGSLLYFNSIHESEISQTNKNNESFQKKFQRKNAKSVTRVDKSYLNQKLKNYEMSIPILTETLIIQQKGNLKENYEIKKKIGSGPYGVVYKARNIYLKNIVAIKVIKKIKDNKEDDNNIKNHINILKKLNHPNIVKIYEFYSNNNYYQIIAEYCKKGELYKYIRRSFTEKQFAVIFYQILSGLNYLHDKKIVHKNIKLKNIMVVEKEEDLVTQEEYFWIKIVDFQTAEFFQNNRNKNKPIDNSYYTSPEALQNNYVEKSDIWSVGVMLHIALTGKVPFDGKTDDEINYKIKNLPYNNLDPRLLAHSNEVKDLLDNLLQKDINKRLSSKEALNHEWFKKYKARDLFSNFRPHEIQHYINNLCNYSFEPKICQLVLAFIVHNIPQSISIYNILKLFRYFNLSGDCKLTKDELKKGLYNYRNEEQVDKIVDQLFLLLDGDNNGYIEFEEFMRACVDKKQIFTNENIWYAFKFLDKKNVNSIDVQTLMKAFDAKPNKMLEAVFNKTLNNGDLDNNGIITFREFEEIMKNSMEFK